jgi:hypothetical protein
MENRLIALSYLHLSFYIFSYGIRTFLKGLKDESRLTFILNIKSKYLLHII